MIIRQFDIFGGYQDINTENLTENQISQLKVSLPTQLKEQLQATCNTQNINMTQTLTNLIRQWLDKQNNL